MYIASAIEGAGTAGALGQGPVVEATEVAGLEGERGFAAQVPVQAGPAGVNPKAGFKVVGGRLLLRFAGEGETEAGAIMAGNQVEGNHLAGETAGDTRAVPPVARNPEGMPKAHTEEVTCGGEKGLIMEIEDFRTALGSADLLVPHGVVFLGEVVNRKGHVVDVNVDDLAACLRYAAARSVNSPTPLHPGSPSA